MPRTGGVSVTSRVFALLSAFDAGTTALTLTELSQRAGMPLSTTHRLVGDLVAAGALERGVDGTVSVGRRLWELGLLAPVRAQLGERALPYLQDLYAATGENVHLAVRDGLEVLYVEHVAGRSSVRIVSRPGHRLPLHATGVGKILLAHAGADTVEQAVAHARRVTPYTVTEPARLRRQLAEIRRQGWARTGEEMTLGTASLAVPVAVEARVVAALGIVVPSGRRGLMSLLPALRVAAAGIARAGQLDSRYW
ncbi:MAG: IclR family transcriptional regulator [Actinomycetales bacterium]